MRRGITLVLGRWLGVVLWGIFVAGGFAEVSPTRVCLRWAHQSAQMGSLVYVYGGRSKSNSSQTSNTWNNYFLTLDLSSPFNIASPPLTGLPIAPLPPLGPPAVSLGALWPSSDGKYLYQFGGECSDTPATLPSIELVWKYDILNRSWQSIVPNGDTIQRPAEGASGLIPTDQGKGVYIGGHLDAFTVPGWSIQTPREYLQSMITFDMSTESFSLQSSATFPSPPRADGAVVFVPGLGTNQGGILICLAGGTSSSMLPLTTLSIFDLTTQTWSQIPTSGTPPVPRVNPCTVLAPDNKTIYLYGGQNVLDPIPRPQMSDLWILSLPSYKWVQVPSTNLVGAGVPPGRSQHSCYAVGGEMVVLGGDTGNLGGCDGAGVYVFDMSLLRWKDSFDGLTEFTVPQIVVGGGGSSTAYTYTRVESTVLQPTRTSRTDTDPTWITTKDVLGTVPTTLLDGQSSLMTITFKTTATVTSTSTATSIPPASSTTTQKQTTTPPTIAIVSATLGAIILLLILAWIITAFIKRRKQNAWRNSTSSSANGFLPSRQRGVYQESDTVAEGTEEMREWDVSEWEGGLLRSPRQSLRVVNV